jgi:iron-sulfur cluster repair protein YtfE (RIC family)
MKRRAALEPLSRDHFHALLVAQGLKRANRVTARKAQKAFVDYWEPDGREHFRAEEEILLPLCAGFIDVEQPLVAKVLSDHSEIRSRAAELSAEGTSKPESLHALGEKLEQHVRLEERQLFPLIEESLPEYELDRLHVLLDH